MTDDPTAKPPEDDENPAFLKYLEKNLPWLTEKLKSTTASPPSSEQGDDPIRTFFQKATEKLTDENEALKSLLTPEQWAIHRAPKNAGPNPDKDGQKPDAPPTKPDVKPKSRWL